MAQPTMLETSRSHTVTGAFGNQGGAITAITNTNPTVLTTTSAHGLVANDWIAVEGVTTDTAANGSFQVTSVSGLTVTYPAIGNGSAGFSAATISQALPISAITTDFTVRLRVESLTASKNFQVEIQDSADGFVNDIVTRWSGNFKGQVMTQAMEDVVELRKYNIPGMRFGTAGAYMRLYIVQIDAGATAVTTCWYES
jgi:hypothetical protein